MLQGVTDRLTEIVKCYGMEMNVEKAKGMTICKATIYNTDYDRSKQPGNVEFCKYLGNA